VSTPHSRPVWHAGAPWQVGTPLVHSVPVGTTGVLHAPQCSRLSSVLVSHVWEPGTHRSKSWSQVCGTQSASMPPSAHVHAATWPPSRFSPHRAGHAGGWLLEGAALLEPGTRDELTTLAEEVAPRDELPDMASEVPDVGPDDTSDEVPDAATPPELLVPAAAGSAQTPRA